MVQLHASKRLAAFCLAVFATSVLAADRAEIAGVIEEASQKQQQARKAQYAWSVTNDYLQQARAALEAGDLQAAEAAADRALLAANASLRQASEEAVAWPARVPGS